MIKKYASGRAKLFLVILQQIACIGLIGALLTLIMSSCVKTGVYQSAYYVDLLGDTDEYQKSEVFRYAFEEDIDSIIHYLAICQQFGNGGNFDKDKTIDLLQYVNRKDTSVDYTSNGALEYKVGDLINWSAVDSFETTDVATPESDSGEFYYFSQIRESYLPVDGTSLSDKNLYQILNDAGVINEAGEELTRQTFQDGVTSGDYLIADDADISIDVTERESIELQNAAVQSAQEEAGMFYDQTSLEADTDYEIYLKERAMDLVSQYIISAANDLAENYESYTTMHSYFENNANIKYLYIPAESETTAFYTNCNLQENQNILDLQQIFEEQMKNKDGAYVKYDFNKDEISTSNYNEEDENHLAIRRLVRFYEYSFAGKGTLYIGYLTGDAIKAFGAEAENTVSAYHDAENIFEYVKPYTETYLAFAGVCVLIWLICFVLLTCLTGYHRKQDEEGEWQGVLVTADQLSGFDKWYTAVAAVFALVVEGAICLGTVYFLYNAYLDSEYFPIALDGKFIFAVCMVAMLVFEGLFLLFWTSLVRRIKTHTIWKNGIIYHGYRCLRRLREKCTGKISDSMADRNLVVRLWVPYILFLIGNLILILFGVAFGNTFFGFLFAFVMDLFVGGFLTKVSREKENILNGIRRIAEGEITYQIDCEQMHGESKILAEAVNQIGDGIHDAVEISMKDERLKADLITNVSHDIKTPLTSIINYVDLLKRENIPGEKAQEYIQVLDEKSQRLKQLTLDLLEASKISSGNIVLHMEDIRVKDLMLQVIGEFSDKFSEKELDLVASFPEEASVISADSRRMWRVMENLFNNIYKYAMEGTRVYLDVEKKEKLLITIKNISSQPLNINADELTERFIRGDVSRSTEGSGLGLSIAKSLVEAQKGSFQILLDGDLFKIVMRFETKEVDEKTPLL